MAADRPGDPGPDQSDPDHPSPHDPDRPADTPTEHATDGTTEIPAATAGQARPAEPQPDPTTGERTEAGHPAGPSVDPTSPPGVTGSAGEPPRRSRLRGFVAHRATQTVAALVLGLAVGAGGTALIVDGRDHDSRFERFGGPHADQPGFRGDHWNRDGSRNGPFGGR